MTTREAIKLATVDGRFILAAVRESIGGSLASCPRDDAAIIVDGSQFSPSWRALAGGHMVWEATSLQDDGIDITEAYECELDDQILTTDIEGWSLTWHEGCLWAIGPDAPDDIME